MEIFVVILFIALVAVLIFEISVFSSTVEQEEWDEFRKSIHEDRPKSVHRSETVSEIMRKERESREFTNNSYISSERRKHLNEPITRVIGSEIKTTI